MSDVLNTYGAGLPQDFIIGGGDSTIQTPEDAVAAFENGWQTAQPGTLAIAAPVQSPPNSTGIANTLIGGGFQVLNTVFGYNLQQSQIKNGQVPSIGYNPQTGAPQGQNVASEIAARATGAFTSGALTSNWIFIVIIAVVLIFAFRK